jgi:AcrR family transcriptional regulator
MPPIPDKSLEERILKAAQRLWRTRGEKGLTLRTTAREAGTTTPTLYKRFRNKEALRLALAERFRDELAIELFSSPTVEQMHRRYLAYVEAHMREYELLRQCWGHFFSRPRPVRAWLIAQLAERFGGKPEQYAVVFDAIFLLCHGSSTLLIVAPHQEIRVAIREECIRACDKLLENAALLRANE